MCKMLKYLVIELTKTLVVLPVHVLQILVLAVVAWQVTDRVQNVRSVHTQRHGADASFRTFHSKVKSYEILED